MLKDHLKTKAEYDATTGTVVFIGDKLGDLPRRHVGEFRYLVIDSYQFPFEIYAPNSEPSVLHLDSLRIGDTVTAYYFERDNTFDNQLNKFAQFVDRGESEVFVRNSFQKQLGYVMVAGSFGVMLLALVLGKIGKLEW